MATATTKLYLARVLRDAKRNAEAETLLREASEVMPCPSASFASICT